MTVLVNPYIMLNGNAKKAIEFYAESLDAKVLFQQTFGEAIEDPERPLPEEFKERVAHSVLKIGEMELLVADSEPGQQTHTGDRVTICMTTNEVEKAQQMYTLLQQGGKVNIPLTETYFSPAYGVVTDQFGVTFQIFTRK
ncbi:VOC family protein [Shimazuella alba]|uniref:VOC family protein n=1 Tax=Shimazuella alba TaxID=2690964 RepID=A0A6I4VRP1_9BACL|nr:VOC family protein [Shimazuella alba]MXQ53098.1 VOC family protein [Shimazuella alba]